MPRNSRNATPKAGPSKLRPPEPSSSPPPGPPPPPKPVSFAEGADFISFEDYSDASGAVLGDQIPMLSITAKGKQKATEPNGSEKKRKSDALEDPFDSSRKVRSKIQPPNASRSQPWMKHVRWDGCLNAAEMYASPSSDVHPYSFVHLGYIER